MTSSKFELFWHPYSDQTTPSQHEHLSGEEQRQFWSRPPPLHANNARKTEEKQISRQQQLLKMSPREYFRMAPKENR